MFWLSRWDCRCWLRFIKETGLHTTLTLLITIAFVVYLFLNTYYVIEGNGLRIKAGSPHTIKINIHDIKRVEKSSSLLSSPALSTDRIEIFYGKLDSVLISPKGSSGFVEEFRRVNSTIESRF